MEWSNWRCVKFPTTYNWITEADNWKRTKLCSTSSTRDFAVCSAFLNHMLRSQVRSIIKHISGHRTEMTSGNRTVLFPKLALLLRPFHSCITHLLFGKKITKFTIRLPSSSWESKDTSLHWIFDYPMRLPTAKFVTWCRFRLILKFFYRTNSCLK